MIDLLVVRLQDELAERAAAVSVNLDKVKQNSKTWHTTPTLIQFFLVETFQEKPFHTQGLMSPYLRASMTNFRQSPMSWYEVTPTMKNKVKGNYCHFLFAILIKRNSFLLTLSHPNPQLLDKIQIATFQERFKNRRICLRLQFWGLWEKSKEQEGYHICFKYIYFWNVPWFEHDHTSAGLAAWSCCVFAVFWSSERKGGGGASYLVNRILTSNHSENAFNKEENLLKRLWSSLQLMCFPKVPSIQSHQFSTHQQESTLRRIR